MPDPDSAADALDAYLASDDLEEISDDPDSFEVTNQDTATRLLRRLARINREIADAANAANAATAEHARITAWAEDTTAPLHQHRDWILRALEGFTRRVHDEDPRRQTVKLPTGTLSLRRAAVSVMVGDEDQVRAWAVEADYPALLNDPKPPTVDKAAVKKILRPAGVTVDEASGQWVGEPDRVVDGVAYYVAVDAEGERVPGLLLCRDPSGYTFTATPDIPKLRVIG